MGVENRRQVDIQAYTAIPLLKQEGRKSLLGTQIKGVSVLLDEGGATRQSENSLYI